MEQYISKVALVAEIERLIKEHSGKYECDEAALVLEDLEDFLDTLEVKEVDLDEEIKRFTMSKELYETKSVIRTVAKHFFELGIAVSNKA